MWQCPKCNREFKKNNQGHFCSALGESIDSYIEQSPLEHREVLQRVRETIQKAAPNSIEKLSCKIPTFWQNGNLVQFAVHKNHLGFYPFDEAVNHFAEQITESGYTFNKGCIQMKWDKVINYELIERIIEYRVSQIKKELSS